MKYLILERAKAKGRIEQNKCCNMSDPANGCWRPKAERERTERQKSRARTIGHEASGYSSRPVGSVHYSFGCVVLILLLRP